MQIENFGEKSNLTLSGDHFLVNIALPAIENGMVRVNRDPRKLRMKLPCYEGTVVEIGTRCRLVKPGDRVVFERWQWQQMDVDDELMIARERDLMVINDTTPAPNVIVIQLPEEKKLPLNLLSVDKFNYVRPATYCGTVIATSANPEMGQVGEEIYVESYDYGQFVDSQRRLFFRTDKVALVLLRLERTNVLELQTV